ncbi:MAG TPA: c-type cytochrome [Casimicrobiaceae bacterium]|nr:c-type cytochrome [Casimicrobiaceae bacterium]
MSRCSDRVPWVALALAAAALIGGPCLAVAQPVATKAAAPTARPAPPYGFGKPATPEEIAGWDIDVRPDGKGLPPGKGTVAKGQDVYDAKCASCHGTFGESTDYMAIAGGVGTLASDQPIRTTGSKLNYATTLWDYINRAMPFNAPKTLSVEEVYALTAYVLHLNDLLPPDGWLDRATLIAFRMPNRDGFTTAHGFGSVKGKPDTANVACMTNCVAEVKLSSEFPEHARDSHGNLADQVRSLGPVDGARTAKGGKTSDAQGAAAAPKSVSGPELAKANGCTACHGTTNKIVGPAFADIGKKYGGAADAESALVAKVKQGGAGAWGQMPMPPQPQVKDADARAIVQWILGGAR